MHHRIQYGTREISFTIVKSKRKTFGVTVYPDKSVLVLAPIEGTNEEILKRFKRRLPWVIRHIDYFDKIAFSQNEKQYVSGESFFYLGKQYRLKIVKSILDKVSIRKGFITVYTTDTADREKISNLVAEWYRECSLQVYTRLINEYQPKFEKYEIIRPKINVRPLKSKWGSCSRTGTITLNASLIMNDISLIRYVIIHEMCHLVHFNHTKEFYALLTSMLPEWKKNKEILDYSEI